jgi:hypothetical protein
VPSDLVALSAPLIRSRVTPVRVVAQLDNEALHTPAPGPGPVESPAAAVVAEAAKVVVEDVTKILPPTR